MGVYFCLAIRQQVTFNMRAFITLLAVLPWLWPTLDHLSKFLDMVKVTVITSEMFILSTQQHLSTQFTQFTQYTTQHLTMYLIMYLYIILPLHLTNLHLPMLPNL